MNTCTLIRVLQHAHKQGEPFQFTYQLQSDQGPVTISLQNGTITIRANDRVRLKTNIAQVVRAASAFNVIIEDLTVQQHQL